MPRFEPRFALLSGTVTSLYLGLTVWAWGEPSGFFGHPARIGLVGASVILTVISWFSGISGCSPRPTRLARWEVDLCPADDPRFGHGVVTALRRPAQPGNARWRCGALLWPLGVSSRQPDPGNDPDRLGTSLQRACGRAASPPAQDRRRLSVRAAPELFGGAVGHGGLDAGVPQRARAFAGVVSDTFRSRADPG